MRDRHWTPHKINPIVIAVATGFLILHGVDNVRPPEHWQSLLAAQLVEHGLEVRYPALPEPEAPDLERWLAALEQELAALRGEQADAREGRDLNGTSRRPLGQPGREVQVPSLLDVAKGIVNKVGACEQ
jgi:hypothetical protein